MISFAEWTQQKNGQTSAAATPSAKSATPSFSEWMAQKAAPPKDAQPNTLQSFRDYEQKDKAAADAQAAQSPILKADTLVQRLEQRQIENTGERGRVGNVFSGAGKTYAGSLANIAPALQARNVDVENIAAENERAQKMIAQYKAEIASGTLTTGQKKLREAQIYSLERDIKATSGLPAAEQKYQETKYDLADKLTASGQRDIAEAKEGLGKTGQFLVDLGVGGAQLAGDIGIAALTGGSALIPMAARSFGGGAQEARASGATEQQAALYGLGSAGLSVLTERLSNVAKPMEKFFGRGLLGAGRVEAAIRSAIQRLNATDAGKAVLNRLATAALSAGGEGLEEVLEGAVTPLLKRATYDKDAQWDMTDIMYQGLIGASLGGALGGIGGSAQTSVEQTQAQTPVQSAAETAQAPAVPATPAEVQTPQVDAPVSVADAYTASVAEQTQSIVTLEQALETEMAKFRALYAEFRSTDIENRRPELLTEAQEQQKRILAAEKELQKAQDALSTLQEEHTRAEQESTGAAQIADIMSGYENRFISKDAITQMEKTGAQKKEVAALRSAYEDAAKRQKTVNRLIKRLAESDSLLESASIQNALDKANAKLDEAARKLQDAQAALTQKSDEVETPAMPAAPAQEAKPSAKTAPAAPRTLWEQAQEEVKKNELPPAENTVVMRREKTKPSPQDAFTSFYARAFDTQYPIAKYAKAAGDGTDVLASNTRNAGGTVNFIFEDALVDRNGNKIGDSLRGVLSTVPADQQTDFWNYMVQRQNIDRAREGKNAIPNYTSEMSARAVSRLEAEHPEWKATGNKIINWIDTFNREWGVNSGIINADVYNALRDTYKSYFPLQRMFEDIEKTSGDYDVTKKFIDETSPLKKAKGSARDIKNPVENIMNMVNNTVKIARYNAVGQNILNSVRSNPDALNKYAEIIDAKTVKMGKTDNIVSVLENGEKVYLKINDVSLLKSLKGLPKTTITIPVASHATQLFKSLITQKNPFFAVRNVARDVPTAYIYGSEANPVKFAGGLFSAAKDIATNSENYQRYKAVGGGMANFFNPSNAEAAAHSVSPQTQAENPFVRAVYAAKNKGATIMKGVETFNNMTESTPRLAEFNRVYEKTGDVQKALDASNNVTVNFSRGGDVTKAIDRNGVAYLNAGMQGFDKFVRSFKTPRTAIATIAKAGLAITLPDMILYFMNRDDEDYKQLSNYIKDNYYCVPLGNGEFLKIPKAREFATLFGSLFDRILRAASGEKNAFKGFGSTVATSFAPTNPIKNNLLSPITWNLAKNETFSGAKIVPESMLGDNRSKYLQYDEKTSKLTIAIAKAAIKYGIDISPKQMDYLIDAYTGVVADFLLPATTASKSVGNTIKAQFVSDPTYSNQEIVDFYDNYDEIQTKATDRNIAESIPSKNLTEEEIMRGAMGKASETISMLSKIALRANLGTLTKDDVDTMRDYGVDYKLTGDALQKALRTERVNIARDANDLYDSGDTVKADIYRSERVADKVKTYSTAAGISQGEAYSLYKTLDALEPEKGAKSVTTVQKANAVLDYSGLAQEKKTKLLGVLYTTTAKTSLLGDIEASDKLIALYQKTGDATLLSSQLAVPDTFSEDKTEYEMTDAEKDLFKKAYLDFFNKYAERIIGMGSAEKVQTLKRKAYEKAKVAVIRSRR